MEYCFIYELTHWIQIQLQADVESLKQETQTVVSIKYLKKRTHGSLFS